MAFVVNGVKTIRNHWKKTVFFIGATAYGCKYAKGKYDDEQLRREYCVKAREYGNARLYSEQRLRKVTVFLNPVANDRECRIMFEKNVAPILNLAGVAVNIIKTEYEGQLKKYMAVIGNEDADAIVIAGGDGTLMEVVTGLMRRQNNDPKAKMIPIGVLPLGRDNTVAKMVFDGGKGIVHQMLEAAFAVVEGAKMPLDVMEVKGEDGKSVYSVSSFQWGEFRTAEDRKEKKRWLGPLRHKFTYHSSISKSNWPPLVKGKISYTLPCAGCSKCQPPPPKPDTSWSSRRLFSFRKPEPVKIVKDYSGIINEKCGEQHDLELSNIEMTILSTNLQKNNEQDDRGLKFSRCKDTMTKSQFLHEGFRRVQLPQPHTGADTDENFEHIQVRELNMIPDIPEGQEEWYTIDGEKLEAKAVDIKLLKNQIEVFCPWTPTKR